MNESPTTITLQRPEANRTVPQRAAPLRDVIAAVRLSFSAVDRRAHEQKRDFVPNRFDLALAGEKEVQMANDLHQGLARNTNIAGNIVKVRIIPEHFSQRTGLGREVVGLELLDENDTLLLPNARITIESLAPTNGHARNVVAYSPVNSGYTICNVVGDTKHFYINDVDAMDADLPQHDGETLDDRALYNPLLYTNATGSGFVIYEKSHLGVVVPVIDEEKFEAYLAQRGVGSLNYALLPDNYRQNQLPGVPTSMLCISQDQSEETVL